MATTFHPFPRLPLELRLMIWEATISPHIIDVHHVASLFRPKSRRRRRFGHLVLVPPPPPILHTCRESRNVALNFQGGYQKAFSDWCLSSPYFDGSWGRRYIWVNFELDMSDIGDQLSLFSIENRSKIKHLKIEFRRLPYWTGRVWDKCEGQAFGWSIERNFGQLREICVCIPCEEAPLGLPPDWLPGGSHGAFMEGWRAVDYTVSSGNGDEDRDGERSEDGKTDGKMWVLVLKKIDTGAADSSL